MGAAEVEFAVQQRRANSPLALARNWSECAASRHATRDLAEADIRWWSAYDAVYSITGWEYRVVEVKKRKEAADGGR